MRGPGKFLVHFVLQGENMKNKIVAGLLITVSSFFLLSPLSGTGMAQDKTLVTVTIDHTKALTQGVQTITTSLPHKVTISAKQKEVIQKKALDQFLKDVSIYLEAVKKANTPKIGTQPKHKVVLHISKHSIQQSSGSGVKILPGGYKCYHGCISPVNACVLPNYICKRESRFIDVQNPHSSACGKYQFVRGTWNNYGGYRSACDAPESVQDAKALEVWDNGNGASHWRP